MEPSKVFSIKVVCGELVNIQPVAYHCNPSTTYIPSQQSHMRWLRQHTHTRVQLFTRHVVEKDTSQTTVLQPSGLDITPGHKFLHVPGIIHWFIITLQWSTGNPTCVRPFWGKANQLSKDLFFNAILHVCYHQQLNNQCNALHKLASYTRWMCTWCTYTQ